MRKIKTLKKADSLDGPLAGSSAAAAVVSAGASTTPATSATPAIAVPAGASGGSRREAPKPATGSSAASKANAKSAILRTLVRIAAIVTAATLVIIVGYILIMGIPALTPEMFALEYTSDNSSMLPALVNTLLAVVLTLLIAVTIGVASAIFLVEYTGRGNRFVRVVRIAAETLTGIPSIVYGLFGLLFFVTYLQWGLSLLSGCLTLAIMVLPTIMRTTEEALLAVPDSYREGSFGLGAGRLRTVFAVVLPAAMPGILSGIILSMGRIIGESAALIFTAGTVAQIPASIMGSARTMAVHMYVLSSEGLHIDAAYATAVVLLALALAVNALAALISKRLTKDA